MTGSGRARKKTARPRTALQKHVDFFDADGDGRITLAETYGGLRRVGFGVLRSAGFAFVINAALGPKTSRSLTLSIDTQRIHVGRHQSDTAVYDQDGQFVAARFRALFAQNDTDEDGAIGADEMARMFSRNRRDLIGHLVSRIEFGLLLEIAGEKRNGRKVLTRRTLEDFYNGSLFHTLAGKLEERQTRPARSAAAPGRRRARPGTALAP